jgi:hypothetical protein
LAPKLKLLGELVAPGLAGVAAGVVGVAALVLLLLLLLLLLLPPQATTSRLAATIALTPATRRESRLWSRRIAFISGVS